MKRFLILLSILFCTTVFAHTIEWYVGDTLLSTTTCDSGDNITPPTAPAKYGYHFNKWKPEFTPIEYLESTGTQWIDTGFAYNQQISQKNFSMTMSYSFPIYVSEKHGTKITFNLSMSGVYPDIMSLVPYYYNNNGIWFDQKYSKGPDGKLFYGIFTKDTLSYFTVTIDPSNMTYTATGNFFDTINGLMTSIAYSDNNLYIFKSNGNTAPNFPFRLYGLSFESDNILVRDFIPVLDKDDIPCLYDRVSKQFFYNQGTGQFIAGPIIE